MSPDTSRIRKLMRDNAKQRAIKRADEDEASAALLAATGSPTVADLMLKREVPKTPDIGEPPF